MDGDKQSHKVKVYIKDWGIREVAPGTSILELLRQISGKLAKEALAAKVDSKVIDLNTPVYNDVELQVLTFDDAEGMQVYRHTASHVMAQAVKELYANVRLGIGPSIRDGFYYDFDLAQAISLEELAKIEAQMKKIIKEDLPLQRIELEREEAIKLFTKMGEKYKVELVEGLAEGSTISCYRQGDFIDLCAGPHLPSTGKLKAVKLLNLAGAYWRGDEKRPMLQRIYGTAFPKAKQLEEYLQRLEEAKKRITAGWAENLTFSPFTRRVPAFLSFIPRYYYQAELENFWREEHRKAGYLEIETPIILNRQLWEQSGHWIITRKICTLRRLTNRTMR